MEEKVLKPVTNMNTLKAMAKAGHIILHPQTGTQVSWYTGTRKCDYIDGPGENQPSYFNYKNKSFIIKYVSGCFYPYVFEEVKKGN